MRGRKIEIEGLFSTSLVWLVAGFVAGWIPFLGSVLLAMVTMALRPSKYIKGMKTVSALWMLFASAGAYLSAYLASHERVLAGLQVSVYLISCGALWCYERYGDFFKKRIERRVE